MTFVFVFVSNVSFMVIIVNLFFKRIQKYFCMQYMVIVKITSKIQRSKKKKNLNHP